MRPRFRLLDESLIKQILAEAFHVVADPGVRVAPSVFDLLRGAGIDIHEGVAHISEAVARAAQAVADQAKRKS